MKKILFLTVFVSCIFGWGCQNGGVTTFSKLTQNYSAGEGSDSLKILIVEAAKNVDTQTIEQFLLEADKKQDNNYFLEELASICILKMPQSTRYSGEGRALFLKYIKFGEKQLMTDFFNSWDLNVHQTGFEELKEQALQLTQNYFQNYLIYYTTYYRKPIAFSPEWVHLGLLHSDSSDKESYQEHIKMIELFQSDRIDDLISRFENKYLHPPLFPKGMKGVYYCGAESKLILIACNKIQCERMIALLDNPSVPKEYSNTLKLFKGKMAYLNFYNRNN